MEHPSEELTIEQVRLLRWHARYPQVEAAMLKEARALLAEGRPANRIQCEEVLARVRAIHGIKIPNDKGFFSRLLAQICPEIRPHLAFRKSKFDPLFQ